MCRSHIMFIRSRCKRKTKFFLSNTNSRPTDRNGVYKKIGTHNTSKHTGLTSKKVTPLVFLKITPPPILPAPTFLWGKLKPHFLRKF